MKSRQKSGGIGKDEMLKNWNSWSMCKFRPHGINSNASRLTSDRSHKQTNTKCGCAGSRALASTQPHHLLRIKNWTRWPCDRSIVIWSKILLLLAISPNMPKGKNVRTLIFGWKDNSLISNSMCLNHLLKIFLQRQWRCTIVPVVVLKPPLNENKKLWTMWPEK
jgi:hypothetical protein